MTTLTELYTAAVNAVITNAEINRAGVVDAMQIVLPQGLSNVEGNAFIDALATSYADLGIINAPTFGAWRRGVTSNGADNAINLFEALAIRIHAMPETEVVVRELTLYDLRGQRDNLNAALDKLNETIDAIEVDDSIPKIVRGLLGTALRQSRKTLHQMRVSLRDEIRNLSGDADS